MSNKQKWIITGFAWMYGGFIMILPGTFAVVDKPKKEKEME